MTSRTVLRTVCTTGALAGSAVVLAAGPAAAHVTVHPEQAEQGDYGKVAFRVPNEEAQASTTKLQVYLPKDQPLASVSVRPTPGWKVTIDKRKLDKPIKTEHGTVTRAVSRITWSGGSIKPDRFQEFQVSLGPLPKKSTRMVFKALQTYSNGDVVRWIENPKPGGAEPEHPAPTLRLTPPKKASASASHSSQDSAAADGGPDNTARTLGVVGIVVGAAGVGFGVFGLRRATRGARDTT